MPKSSRDTLKDRIKTIQARIAKDRDDLRALFIDAQDVISDCDEAHQALDTAIDALSRLQ